MDVPTTLLSLPNECLVAVLRHLPVGHVNDLSRCVDTRRHYTPTTCNLAVTTLLLNSHAQLRNYNTHTAFPKHILNAFVHVQSCGSTTSRWISPCPTQQPSAWQRIKPSTMRHFVVTPSQQHGSCIGCLPASVHASGASSTTVMVATPRPRVAFTRGCSLVGAVSTATGWYGRAATNAVITPQPFSVTPMGAHRVDMSAGGARCGPLMAWYVGIFWGGILGYKRCCTHGATSQDCRPRPLLEHKGSTSSCCSKRNVDMPTRHTTSVTPNSLLGAWSGSSTALEWHPDRYPGGVTVSVTSTVVFADAQTIQICY